MKKVNVIDFVYNILLKYIKLYMMIVDVICGNGYDILFLVFRVEYVYVFDI